MSRSRRRVDLAARAGGDGAAPARVAVPVGLDLGDRADGAARWIRATARLNQGA